MKKSLTICILSIINCAVAFAQSGDRIYTYDNAGEVVSNMSYIQPFDLWEESIDCITETNMTVYSADKSYQYDIQLSKFPEEASTQMFEAIDIRNNNKTIFSLHSYEAWRPTPSLNLGHITVRHLDVHVTALVFLGWCYDSTPPWITIVILNKDKATVVFNQRGVVTECRTDLPYGLNIRYVDKIQEYDNEEDTTPSPADSELKKFRIWQEGQYLRFAQTQ